MIIENNAEGSMVATQLHYDIEYPNVFVQGMTKSTDIGITMSRKIKRVGCSTLKELLEENRLSVVDRHTITELMTYVNKGSSFEADGGCHDDMVMNCVMFAWFVSTPLFKDMSSADLKSMLYAEKQKEIEDDIVPIGIIGTGKGGDMFKEGGDVWTVVDNDDSYGTF